MSDEGTSDGPSSSRQEMEDPFLAHHLPGSSQSVRTLRAGVSSLNSSFNRSLLRVLLITGESGAGKNHVARVTAAHRAWLDEESKGELGVEGGLETYTSRYVEIPLPTLSDELLESELFGHKKGAFTGAFKDRIGLFGDEIDDVLLDEIGDASAAVQAKLLRVIETRRFRPVGGQVDDDTETNARIMLATHRDLWEFVREGRFREDLYWRAAEFQLHVPALREQPENIPAMIEYQLERLLPLGMYSAAPGEALRQLPALSGADLTWAVGYQWPGNLRQLRHVLVRWLASGGSAPLKELAAEMESAVRQPARRVEPEVLIHDAVRERLENGLNHNTPVAAQLGDLIDNFRREVENAVVAWYDSRRPSPSELLGLFPGMKPNSIVSKLSQWRTR